MNKTRKASENILLLHLLKSHSEDTEASQMSHKSSHPFWFWTFSGIAVRQDLPIVFSLSLKQKIFGLVGTFAEICNI